ncbi:phosphonate ABC transporter, permease protein PhnE [Saccharopolyspora sp. K220]|uniref:phosphonate ABC transporter, permease protein PhnE n=1 Tax=Saccharopolyspora soli TaxID=2926618 RepID=UPI001F56BC04|nr:phosphonate ABC transporter, permease protein PhnE [Saccharopolyspora soli]MCI2419377.1 phosphonate ABC transporter, permease protein PhnE [Saccharopolyspora soli]
MTTTVEAPRARRVKSPPHRRTLARPQPEGAIAALVVLALLGSAVWAFSALRLNVATIVDGFGNAVDFASRTLPLDFPSIGELLSLSGQTLAIVVCATLVASLLSMPIAVLAARNTALGSTSRFGARVLIVVARAVPDVVLAIVFFRMFGFGGLTGVLAMGLHSTGMIGKLYADAIEQVDEGPRTAIRAAGGTRLQQLVSGVLPQVVPSFVATSLHRLDINLRVSVVLGFVGVGGLGKAIADSLRTLDYQRGMALASVVFLLCVLVEIVSGSIRQALLGVREERRGVVAALTRRAVVRKSSSAVPKPARPSAAPRISPPWTAGRLRRTGYWLLTALIVVASIWGADISFAQFERAVSGFGPTLGLFWPPETGGILDELLGELLVTIQIALAATLIGAVLALPIGALAADNVAPNPAVAKFFRGVVLAVRGVPELVLAIVFVVITGLGAVAGALALGVGSVGLLGKLVADSLEEVDRGREQALRATGANRLQVFFAATVPQAAPAFVAHVLYQLDTNLRSATLLGLVGAGGIGYYLLNASRVLDFGVVTTVLLLTFATVLLVELLAVWLRRVLRGS